MIMFLLFRATTVNLRLLLWALNYGSPFYFASNKKMVSYDTIWVDQYDPTVKTNSRSIVTRVALKCYQWHFFKETHCRFRHSVYILQGFCLLIYLNVLCIQWGKNIWSPDDFEQWGTDHEVRDRQKCISKLISILMSEISIWPLRKTWFSTWWQNPCWQSQKSDVSCSLHTSQEEFCPTSLCKSSPSH